jgi:anti-sigma factor RsiW
MTSEQDRILRAALALPVEQEPDAAFTAAVLHRLGRRRCLLQWLVRLIIFAAALAITIVIAPHFLSAYALVATQADSATVALGLSLLFFCALAFPALRRRT